MNTASRVSSSRPRAAKPIDAPSQTTFQSPGRFQNRYAASSTRATSTGESVSESASSSLIQMFG